MKQLLIAESDIRKRIGELANQIDCDYQGKELIIVCVLKGSIVFLADLIRELKTPIIYDFIFLSSYDGMASSNCITLEKDLTLSLKGQHVLVVEDIFDSGFTGEFLKERIQAEEPLSLRFCILLQRKDFHGGFVVDYSGFEIGPQFVVGYGLDYRQKYRQLKDLYILTETEE